MRPTNLEPHIQTLRGIRARHRAMTLLELLIVLSVIALLAGILFPVFAQARSRARRTVCLSNMKQDALAIRLYIDDYDQRYPSPGIGNPNDSTIATDLHIGFCQGRWPDYLSWVDLVLPYVGRSVSNSEAPSTIPVRIPPVFYCPADMRRFVAPDSPGPDPRKAKSSYEFKTWLASNHSETEIISPAKMVLLWEIWDYHNGGKNNEWDSESLINLMMTDGHCHWTLLGSTNLTVTPGSLKLLSPDLHNFYPGMGPTQDHYGEDIP